MLKKVPKNHVSVPRAALILDHSVRWVKERIKSGDLEGYQWGPNDITVSLDSIARLEEKVRIDREKPELEKA